MTAGAGTYEHQAIGAGSGGDARKLDRVDVREDEPAVPMHPLGDRTRLAERGNHDLGLIPQHDLDVRRRPRVRRMQDQVRNPRRGVAARRQLARDLVEPRLERGFRSRIQRRERRRHPSLACGDHQLRPGHQEHGRNDRRQRATGLDDLHHRARGASRHDEPSCSGSARAAVARSTRFRTFPCGLIGSESTNATDFGTL